VAAAGGAHDTSVHAVDDVTGTTDRERDRDEVLA
jgi:hypothetical protein